MIVYTVSERVCDIKHYVKMYTALLQFSSPNLIFPSRFQLLIFLVWGLRCSQCWGYIMWYELGHRIVWYIYGYDCFRGAFLVCLQRPSDDGSSRSRPNRLFWPFTLHCPITEKTTISNLNVIHFSCIVSHCYQKRMYTRQVICSPALLHYALIWTEMYRRKYNEKQ